MMDAPKYLPTGCPISIPDPEKRKRMLEDIRINLWDRILIAQEQVAAIGHEIDLCDMEINEARAIAALARCQNCKIKSPSACNFCKNTPAMIGEPDE